jgi:hypothetical protein
MSAPTQGADWREMPAGREMDALVAERVLGWQRYGAIRYGKRFVVVVPSHADCWNYTRTQGDPGTWEPTTEPVSADVKLVPYSADIAAAWRILDWVRGCDPSVRAAFSREMGGNHLWHLRAGDAALAICRAALAAVEAR